MCILHSPLEWSYLNGKKVCILFLNMKICVFGLKFKKLCLQDTLLWPHQCTLDTEVIFALHIRPKAGTPDAYLYVATSIHGSFIAVAVIVLQMNCVTQVLRTSYQSGAITLWMGNQCVSMDAGVLVHIPTSLRISL